MRLPRWLRSRKSRSPRHARRLAHHGQLRDWTLEERCLLAAPASLAIPFPAPTVNSPDPVSKVLYDGVTGSYQKTITITNNSPTETVYAFLEGNDNRQAVSPYEGTGAFDPYDASNQEYRAYVGYSENGTDFAGLPPLSSITITVPLVFWDSGRIIFSTDGPDQFATYGGPDGGSPTGAPFYYFDTNTQAIYYGNIDSSDPARLSFTPIYNSFDPQNGGKPSTKDWKSPVASGLFANGHTFTVTGPGLPAGGYQVTIDSSHPDYVTLPSPVKSAQTAQQYVFTALPNQSISPTDRYIEGGFDLTQQGAPSTNGLVMWYHALTSKSPNNDAPFQLTEASFRGAFYDPTQNKGTGFQYLLGPDVIKGAQINSVDYDISFVDTINLPVAMEARDVSIPNTDLTAPFGWVGSGQTLQDLRDAVAAFTSNNPPTGDNTNFLGSYFDGKGYPSYLSIDPGDLKLPAGQNLFLASPAIGGAADIQYYKSFPSGPPIQEPLYALTSGGSGPIQLSIGGDPSHPSQGHFLGLNTSAPANAYALNNFIAPNVLAGHTYVVTYNDGGNTVTVGNVTGLYYAPDGKTIIGVKLDGDAPSDPSSNVYSFTLPKIDYAAGRIAGLWYSWAKYYAQYYASAAPLPSLPGTLSGNILTLSDAAPSLVPGMGVTAPGLPDGTVILSIASDHKTIELSTTVKSGATATGSPTSFTFANPSFDSIVGYDPTGNTPPVDLSFTADEQSHALAFAQTVFVAMSAWSASVPANTPNAWDPLLVNIIGGNLGPNYLPDANTDVVNTLTVLSKSALRGVPDFTNPLYSNPAQWYPDPALAAGGQSYNVYNLDPFVWFIHDKLGITAYAFALDDDIGNVNAGGATHLDVSIGGLAGLQNRDPYTNVSPWGVLTSPITSTEANSSILTGLGAPVIVNQVAQYDYNNGTAGTIVNGPGAPKGTTVQFLQVPQDVAQSRIILSNPLTTASSNETYAFFGPQTFTGTIPLPFGTGQPDDTILLNSLDAYNTLLKLGPLQNIQVNGEGIPTSETVTIKKLTRDATTGVVTLQLDASLDPSLVSQPGSFYAYTFGAAVVPLVHDPSFEWAIVQGLANNFNDGKQVSQNTVDWTFTNGASPSLAGIAYNNDSKFTTGNPPAPQGLQVGFVQGDSDITQSVTLGDGSYSLSLDAAQSAINQSPQTLNVYLGSTLIGTITPGSTSYTLSTIHFTVEAGTYTLKFQGTQSSGSTILIDAVDCRPTVSLQSAPPPVFDAIPPLSVNEGSLVSFTAHASESASALTYSLAPGAPSGAKIDPLTGAFTWTPIAPGHYLVTIHVVQNGSPSVSADLSVPITVIDVAPVVTLDPVPSVSPTSTFLDTGSFASLTPGSFIAAVDYGDGTGLQRLNLSPSGTFVLDHTFTHPGTFTITVGVLDSYGLLGTQKLTLTAAPLVSGFGRRRDAFVTALYLTDLNRLPAPIGLNHWSGLLASGASPRAVALRIWASSEHRTLVNRGLVAPVPFARSYVTALLARHRAARFHLPPPAGPLTLRP